MCHPISTITCLLFTILLATLDISDAAVAVPQSPSALLPLQRQKKSLQEDLALILAESLPPSPPAVAATTSAFRERQQRRVVVKKDPRHANVKTMASFPSNRDGSFFSERLRDMDAQALSGMDSDRRHRNRHHQQRKRGHDIPRQQKHSISSRWNPDQSSWNPYFPAMDDAGRASKRRSDYLETVDENDYSPTGNEDAEEAAAIDAALKYLAWQRLRQHVVDRNNHQSTASDNRGQHQRIRNVIKRSSVPSSGKTTKSVAKTELEAILSDDGATEKVKRNKVGPSKTKIESSSAETHQRSVPKEKAATNGGGSSKSSVDSADSSKVKLKAKVGGVKSVSASSGKVSANGAPVSQAEIAPKVTSSASSSSSADFKGKEWLPGGAERTLRSKKSWDEYVGIDKRSALPPSEWPPQGTMLIGGNGPSYGYNGGYGGYNNYESDGKYDNDDNYYQNDVGGNYDEDSESGETFVNKDIGGDYGSDEFGGHYGIGGDYGVGRKYGVEGNDPLRAYLVEWYFNKMLHGVGNQMAYNDYAGHHEDGGDSRDVYQFVASEEEDEDDRRKKRRSQLPVPHRLMTASTDPAFGGGEEIDGIDDVNPPLRVVEERLRKLEDVILLSATRLLEKEMNSRHGGVSAGGEVAGVADANESDVVDHLKAAFGLEKVRDALVEFREAFNKIRAKEDLAVQLSGREEAERKMKKRTGGMSPAARARLAIDGAAAAAVKKDSDGEKKTAVKQTNELSTIVAAPTNNNHGSPIVRSANSEDLEGLPCPVMSDAVEYCDELSDALGEVGHLFGRQCVEHMLCYTCDSSPASCDNIFLREAASFCGDDFRCQAIAGAMRSVFLSNHDEFRANHHALCRADRCVEKLRRLD